MTAVPCEMALALDSVIGSRDHTTAGQPDAAYHLVQTVLIQNWSLHVAQNKIAELEKSLAEAKRPFSYPLAYWTSHASPPFEGNGEVCTVAFLRCLCDQDRVQA